MVRRLMLHVLRLTGLCLSIFRNFVFFFWFDKQEVKGKIRAVFTENIATYTQFVISTSLTTRIVKNMWFGNFLLWQISTLCWGWPLIVIQTNMHMSSQPAALQYYARKLVHSLTFMSQKAHAYVVNCQQTGRIHLFSLAKTTCRVIIDVVLYQSELIAIWVVYVDYRVDCHWKDACFSLSRECMM
jgi:hypothetical protein